MRSYKTSSLGPIGALLWENLRLTYLAFIVALILGAGVTHSLAEVHRLQPNTMWEDPVLPSYAMCSFALFMYGAILLFSLADPKSLTMRIPARHYTLPVKTSWMVATHLAYRVLSFTLLALTLSALMRVEFGELTEHDMAIDLTVAVLLFSYALAVAWSWGMVRPLATAMIVAALPAISIGAMIVLDESRQPPAMPMSGVYSQRLGLAGSEGTRGGREDAASFFAPSEVGAQNLAQDRASEQRGRGSEPRAGRRMRSDAEGIHQVELGPAPTPRPTKPSTILFGMFGVAAAHLIIAFACGLRGRTGSDGGTSSGRVAARVLGSGPKITPSAQQAQMWYEWRRKGYVFPGMTLCFVIVSGIIALCFDGEIDDLPMFLVIAPAYASIFTAFFTGLYMLSVDYRHASSGLSTFLYTRPLSTDAYTRARLRMSVQSVLLNLCLCITCALAGLSLSGGREIAGELEEVSFFAFAFLAYGLMLWSLLWMSIPVLVYLLWFGCYFYYQSMVTSDFSRVSEYTHMFWLVWIPAVVMLVATAVVWRHPATWQALSDVTLSRARKIMVVALFTMGMCLWLSGEFPASNTLLFEGLTVVLAVLGLSMVPALAIISQPLLLEKLRRR
ncbi:MAG: hypothetical protein IT364_11955 [Candidatus Hydrogenedentes bacterium]|nr:hypothetical protein [Candidatus Hydrogenedentota bacterium]